MIEINYKVFSTFEKFQKEIETERLSFGPCHSTDFWNENYKKIEKDNFSIISSLVKLLDSPDEMT